MLNISVAPKPGRILVWQNVLDGDLASFDPQTVHLAEPVLGRGTVKQSANLWVHLSDYRSSFNALCRHSSFFRNRWIQKYSERIKTIEDDSDMESKEELERL